MSTERTPRRGLMLIVSSPSGAGKTSLCKRLMAEFPALEPSVSVTTRAPRKGEKDGREYRFITEAEFMHLKLTDDLLESAEVHSNLYGSPRPPVQAALADGRDVLFDIDWQGARQISAKSNGGEAVRVFILPPSMDELERRLHGRAQDGAEVIARRLANARGEIEHWGEYDYVIVNDDLESAYAQLKSVYCAERDRRERNGWLEAYVEGLLET